MIYRRSPGFVVRRIGTHALLVPVEGAPPDGSLTLLLDGPVALSVWDALSTPHTAEELVDGVLVAFDVEREVAARDVSTFLEQLLALGCASVA